MKTILSLAGVRPGFAAILSASVAPAALVATFTLSGCSGDDDQSAATIGKDAGGQADVVKDSATTDHASSDTSTEATDANHEATTDAGNDATDAGEAGDAEPDAATAAFGVFAGSDYSTTTKVAFLNLATNQPAGAVLPVASGDTVPYARGNHGFLLDRANGDVLVLDPAAPWSNPKTISVLDADAGEGGLLLNPHAAVVATGSKAYVLRYGSNTMTIVDIASGTVTGQIDLSSFVAPEDPDGVVDAWDGVFVPADNRVYLLLGRVDQSPTGYGIGGDRLNHCTPNGPIVVGIDVTTDQVVNNLPGDAGGNAWTLLGQNPSSLVPDLANGRLLIVESGCYVGPDGGAGDSDAGDSYPRQARGIEALVLADGHSSWLYQHDQADRLSDLIWIDSTHAYVERSDSSYMNHWYPWNPTGTTLGAEVVGFPDSPSYDQGRVLGIGTTPVDGGGTVLSIVSMDVGTGQTSTVVSDAFGGDQTLYSYGSAVIR